MAKNFVQTGDVIEVTLAEPVTSGQAVVLGDTLGVALGNATAGQSVAVALEGVWALPKVAGATFPIGSKLLWDASEGAFDAPDAVAAPGDLLGCALACEPGIDGATTVEARLTPGNTGDLQP